MERAPTDVVTPRDDDTVTDYPLEFGPTTRRVMGGLVVGLTFAITVAWMWVISVPGRDLLLLPLGACLLAILVGVVVEMYKWIGRVRAGRRPPFPLAVTCIVGLVLVVVLGTATNLPTKLRFDAHRTAFDDALGNVEEMIGRNPDHQGVMLHIEGVGPVTAEGAPGGVMFRTGSDSLAGYRYIADPEVAAAQGGLHGLGGGWYLDPGTG